MVPVHTPQRAHTFPTSKRTGRQYTSKTRPPNQPQDSTTSYLTATTLIYAIGAGITAAAGTRLALQLFLDKRFKLYSFQLQDYKALYCYLLSLPPRIGIG